MLKKIISLEDFSVASLHDVDMVMIDHDNLSATQLAELSRYDSPTITRNGDKFLIGKTPIELVGLDDNAKITFLMIVSGSGVLCAWRVQSEYPTFGGVFHKQSGVSTPSSPGSLQSQRGLFS